MKVLKTIRVNY